MEKIEEQIRKTDLLIRLRAAMGIVSLMCKDGRSPRMSIPAVATDEDLFMTITMKDAADLIAKLKKENQYLRTWMMMETGMNEEDVQDVVSEEESLPDEVKNRYEMKEKENG